MFSFALSFAAGTLTTLSPCVLPALPLLVGGATQEHRWGPLAMASGLVVSFTSVGFAIASIGTVAGLEQSQLRAVASVALIGVGVLLVSSRLQSLLSRPLEILARKTALVVGQRKFHGLTGQFLLGSLLGALWSPCVGPTLGAAIGLAAEEGSRMDAFLRMLAFGVGAATPLLLAGMGTRSLLRQPEVRRIALAAKPIMGGLIIVLGATQLLGGMEKVEQWILSGLPEAWLRLITSI